MPARITCKKWLVYHIGVLWRGETSLILKYYVAESGVSVKQGRGATSKNPSKNIYATNLLALIGIRLIQHWIVLLAINSGLRVEVNRDLLTHFILTIPNDLLLTHFILTIPNDLFKDSLTKETDDYQYKTQLVLYTERNKQCVRRCGCIIITFLRLIGTNKQTLMKDGLDFCTSFINSEHLTNR